MTSLSVPTVTPMTVMTNHSSTASPLTRAQDFCGSWKRGGPAELMSQLCRDAALIPPPATPNRFCCGDAISLRGGRAS